MFGDAQTWHDLPEERQPTPSADLVIATMGAGKTRVARTAAGQFLERNAVATVGFALPLHRLTAEQAAAFENEIGHNAAIWRGMDQPDPERRDGAKMCLQPELSKAAQDAGASMSPICAVCPEPQRLRLPQAAGAEGARLVLPAPAPLPSEAQGDPAAGRAGRSTKSSTTPAWLRTSGWPPRHLRATCSTCLIVATVPCSASRAACCGRTSGRCEAEGIDGQGAYGSPRRPQGAGLTADLAHETLGGSSGRASRSPFEGNVVRHGAGAERRWRAGSRRRCRRLWGLVEELLRGEHEISTSIEIEPNAELQGGDGSAW